MRLIIIIAVLLVYCSCGKIYPEDNAYHCWSCDLKKNGTSIKLDTCLYGSAHDLLMDSTGMILEGFCWVK